MKDHTIFPCLLLLMVSGAAQASDGGTPELRTRATAACASQGDFNRCIVATTEYIFSDRGNKGYKDSAFTRHLDYGPQQGVIKASSPPYTMCVAAVAEVTIEALNFYSKATGDTKPFSIIGTDSWNRMRRTDIRSYLWENEGPPRGRGAGHAFATFGMGEVIGFKDARPGDFVSLDRSKFRPRVTWTAEEAKKFSSKPLVTHEGQVGVWETSGHSTVFLAYLAKDLKSTLQYKGNDTVGFLYFSSQGTEEDGGFGYRWAIFKGATDSQGKNICSTAQLSARKDCGLGGVDRGSLRVGRLWHPGRWDPSKLPKLREVIAAEIAMSLNFLAKRDFDLLKSKPTSPDAQLNLPDARQIFGPRLDERRLKEFIATRVQVELEKENTRVDMERFDGVTD